MVDRAGQAVVLTTDHKPSDPVEQARIEAAGGVVLDGNLNGEIGVARALGDIKFKKKPAVDDSSVDSAAAAEALALISCSAEVGTTVLTADDTFAVVACDGVWDVMSNDEVCEWIRRRWGFSSSYNDCVFGSWDARGVDFLVSLVG